MNFKKLMLCVVLIFFLIGAVSANDLNQTNDVPVLDSGNDLIQTKDVYVSDVGDDSNQGTYDSSYASINKALSNISSSDIATIHLTEGTFSTDKDTNFNINLNHKIDGGSLSIVGEGKDKTFIDGQSSSKFAYFGQNTNITIKNLTFINFKGGDGGTVSTQGILTIDNCKFENIYSTGHKGGAIYSENQGKITVKNSDFIKTSVNNFDEDEFNIQGGGAIFANNIEELNLINNTFQNCRIPTMGNGRGVAIASIFTKTYIDNNKFINLVGDAFDGSLYLNSVNFKSTIINNQFINCSNPSQEFSIVELSPGKYIWLNNTFVNSSNSLGNIHLLGTCDNLILDIFNEIEFNNTSLKTGINTPCHVKDDNGNLVVASMINLKFVGVNKTYEKVFFIDDGKITLSFDELPTNGRYNLYFGDNKASVITVNINSQIFEVWVAPNGNDANNGSEYSPFETIEFAITKALENSLNVKVHVLKGKYTKEGNIGIIMSCLGNVEIIGEEYDKTILDAQNNDFFMRMEKLDVVVENITFTNGYIKGGSLLSGVFLKDCIVTNSTAEDLIYPDESSIDACVINGIKFYNLVYTNNNGEVTVKNNISNGYFANNNNSANTYGFMRIVSSDVIVENCKFINNTAIEGGAIHAEYSNFTSKNNYFENNSATTSGVFKLSNSNHNFENDLYVGNFASDFGVTGVDANSFDVPTITVNNCTYRLNKADKGGTLGLKQGSIINSKFIDNQADKGGAIVIVPILITNSNEHYDEITITNVTFTKNDIYLDVDNLWKNRKYKIDLINLTINFNDLHTRTSVETLTAEVIGPCGAVISGNKLDFILDGEKIGSAPIVNGTSSLKYFGLEIGNYTLTGTTTSASQSSKINSGHICVEDKTNELYEFWVSETGDDNNNGSVVAPFKTIQHAFDEASKDSTNIILHITKGNYNEALSVSSKVDLTLIGDGIDDTIIDAENSNNVITITEGSKQVIIQNLTIQNINLDNTKSGSIASIAPITIENANVIFDSVRLLNNHGGQAIIENKGNLTIKNTEIIKNGYSIKGIISGGDVLIENSNIDFNFAENTLISVSNLEIKNSQINDNFILNTGYVFISSGHSIIIENTKIFNTGNTSENILGIGGYGENLLIPFLSLMATDISVSSITMENNIGYDADEAAFIAFGARGGPNMDTAHKSPVNVYAVNSTFSNFQMIWMTNVYDNATRIFDNCIFENFSAITRSLTEGENPTYNITNSIFISDKFVIDQIGFRTYDFPKGLDLNYNWWGSNDKPVIVDIQNDGQHMDKTFSPNNWLVLVQENGLYKFKLSDGKQLLDYDGNLPVEIIYIKDETNNIISVLNIGGESYKFTSNGDDVIVDWSNPIADVVPLKTVNITVFAQDVNLIYGDSSKFVANFTDIWGDALSNVNVTFSIGEDLIKATTDENGTAYFNINLALGSYIVEVTNPVTHQSIFRTVNVTTDKSIFADDVSAVYGDKSIFSAVFTDEFGYPLINAAVSFNIGDDIVNVTTDEKGSAMFTINFNAGSYNITSVNPVTGQTISNSIVVSKVTTEITAPKVSMVYNDDKYLTVTLKDANGNYLAKSDVTIKVGSNVYNRVTDSKGQVKLLINLAPNTYSTTVSYAGGNNHIASSLKTSVIVKKATPKLTAAKKTFKKSVKTKKYTITLKNNKNKVMKNTKVYIKVKGKTYTAKTNGKGKATFKITKLTKKGTFKATITYKGSKYYNKVTKKVNIKIK